MFDRVLNIPEYFLNMPEYEGIWTNMAKSTYKAFVLHVPVVIPCELERVITYYNEVYNLRGIKLFQICCYFLGPGCMNLAITLTT